MSAPDPSSCASQLWPIRAPIAPSGAPPSLLCRTPIAPSARSRTPMLHELRACAGGRGDGRGEMGGGGERCARVSSGVGSAVNLP